MSDDPQAHPTAPRKASNDALAGSAPDLAHNIVRVAERMIDSAHIGKIFGGTWLLNWLMFFLIGLPALVGGALFIDKLREFSASSRSHELALFQIQSEIELKKMDRTLLGQSALKTLGEISNKLDQQGESTQQLRLEVGQIGADVQTLRDAQKKTDRRVGALAAKQAAQSPAEPAP